MTCLSAIGLYLMCMHTIEWGPDRGVLGVGIRAGSISFSVSERMDAGTIPGWKVFKEIQ